MKGKPYMHFKTVFVAVMIVNLILLFLIGFVVAHADAIDVWLKTR